ncbi:hypothetical protein CWO90_06890 [Bradyrhizobium sp. Leo121]|nr:hypothetical protein CWO90_06890 [Bradyrhizobium sp. Leo121]
MPSTDRNGRSGTFDSPSFEGSFTKNVTTPLGYGTQNLVPVLALHYLRVDRIEPVEDLARTALLMKPTALASGVAVPLPNVVLPALVLARKLTLLA